LPLPVFAASRCWQSLPDEDMKWHCYAFSSTTTNRETRLSAKPIELTTGADPRFSVIWLHGLGADGSDFVPVVPELGLLPSLAGRFIFPHAPYMPVTCNGGYEMRAWYDIISLDPGNRRVDVAGLLASRDAVRRLIAREVERGIASNRIFVAGFSQGGAVAYTTALTHPEPLAGVIALSTYLPAPQLIADEATDANRSIPIFAAHGTEDDVVSIELGRQAEEFLLAQGYQPEWHSYAMPHSVCIDEVGDVGRWLGQRLQHNPHRT
jgi:phospholipase/carboxylesterase